jgi:regulatory protein
MRNISFQEALTRLENLCSLQEKCSTDLVIKMEKWGISVTDKQKILASLKKNKFYDDSRYAVFFVREKQRLNKWGREKIRFELMKKKLEKDVIDSALSEIDSESSGNILKDLLTKKKKTIKYSTPYELKGKLINYGIQRGYDYELVYKLVEEILKY